MKRKPLQVRLHAREPSIVELTLGDRVQIDRLIASPRGYLAERHGRLLDRGVNTVTLAPGHYVFQTLSNANLHVVTGGVSAVSASDPKNPLPPPVSNGDPVAVTGRGDDAPGERPSFTID